MTYHPPYRPAPPPVKPALEYCPSCAVSTRPVEGTCGRCGKPYIV